MTAPERPDVPSDRDSAIDPTPALEQLAAGDPAAFESLFNAYFNRLRRFVYGYVHSWAEAEDVVHDLFLQLWRRHSWLGSVRDLNAYLYHLARNQALNHLKHELVEARWRARQVTETEEGTRQPPDADRDLISSERTAALLRAVDALAPRQRQVILLRWRAQASLEEIADTLGISTNTVEIHITRAHKQLRKTLPHLLD